MKTRPKTGHQEDSPKDHHQWNISWFNRDLYCVVFSSSSPKHVIWLMRIYLSLTIIFASVTQVSVILPALFACLAWYAK